MDNYIADYWMKYYCTTVCTLCGQWGVIDTTGIKTPAGYLAGRRNFCVCPNGQALREAGADIDKVQIASLNDD